MPIRPLLSPELRRELCEYSVACFGLEMNGECTVMIKGPGITPLSLLNFSPMIWPELRYALMKTAPVLSLICYVLPERGEARPCIATFNLARSSDLRRAECLGSQTALNVYLLNEELVPLEIHRLRWDTDQRQEVNRLLIQALTDLRAIPQECYDFIRAEADFRVYCSFGCL